MLNEQEVDGNEVEGDGNSVDSTDGMTNSPEGKEETNEEGDGTEEKPEGDSSDKPAQEQNEPLVDVPKFGKMTPSEIAKRIGETMMQSNYTKSKQQLKAEREALEAERAALKAEKEKLTSPKDEGPNYEELVQKVDPSDPAHPILLGMVAREKVHSLEMAQQKERYSELLANQNELVETILDERIDRQYDDIIKPSGLAVDKGLIKKYIVDNKLKLTNDVVRKAVNGMLGEKFLKGSGSSAESKKSAPVSTPKKGSPRGTNEPSAKKSDLSPREQLREDARKLAAKYGFK